MPNYEKPQKTRVQAMISHERYRQFEKLSELTGSSISRIVRLTLDAQADQLALAIRQIETKSRQTDIDDPKPAPKRRPETKPQQNQQAAPITPETARKPITDDSFAKLIKKQKNR